MGLPYARPGGITQVAREGGGVAEGNMLQGCKTTCARTGDALARSIPSLEPTWRRAQGAHLGHAHDVQAYVVADEVEYCLRMNTSCRRTESLIWRILTRLPAGAVLTCSHTLLLHGRSPWLPCRSLRTCITSVCKRTLAGMSPLALICNNDQPAINYRVECRPTGA